LEQIFSISEVSNEEFIYLVSTFWYRADENFNCFKCKKMFSASVRDTRKACFTERAKEIVNYNNSIKYFKCPSNFFNPAYSQIIDFFRHFQSGALPFSGGLFEQPAKIIEVFRLIENLENERLADQARSQKWQKGQSKLNSRSTSKKR